MKISDSISRGVFLSSIVALFLSSSALSQAPLFDWAVRIGETSTSSAGFSIVADAAGNIYTTGRLNGTIDFDSGLGIFNLTSAGSTDVFVLKQDADGNLIWAKNMGGPNDDFGQSITVDVLGNVYVAGQFQSTADFDPDGGTSNLISFGNYDAFIVKLNSSGALVWAKGIGGTGFDQGWSIAVDDSGNVHTTGSFEGTADFDPSAGTANITSTGSFDAFVSKLDVNGNFVMAVKMGGTNAESSYSIAVDPSGNVYTTGIFNGTADFDPSASVFSLTASGSADIFVSKLSAAGNFVWAKKLGGSLAESSEAVELDHSGNVYITGRFNGTADFDPGVGDFSLTSAGLNDIFVSKLDINGNFIWARNIGGTGSDSANSSSLDASGNVYMTGIFENTVDFDPGAGVFNLASASSNDGFALKLDASGNFMWALAFGGPSNPRPQEIFVNSTGIYTAGWFTGTVDFDPGVGTANLTTVGTNEIFIQKLVQNFITRWNLATSGSGATQLSFGTATSGVVNYTWQEISPGTATGSGSWSGATLSITGLPTGATIRLQIAPTNFQRIIINNGTDRNRLTQVEQWGSTAWTSMQLAFYRCANLQVTATDVPNLSGVTDMSQMFRGCTVLNSPANIGSWNTVAVTNMSGVFADTNTFNQDNGSWNTAAVTNMAGMFTNALVFNRNIGAWNTAAVTTMASMFSGATAFNQDIGAWNTSAVTNMSGMFTGALVFNQNIGAWNTAAVTNMNSMFFSAYVFNQNISGWNTAAVTNMSGMFGYAYAFNQNIGTWNTSAVTNMSSMFIDAFNFNQNIGNWNTSAVTTMRSMFIDAYDFNQNIGAWNTSAVTDMERMFDFATAFNQNIGAWNTVAVTNMRGMFADASAFNQNLGTWTLNPAVNLSNMLNNTSMDCNNYSATLIGWSTNPSTPNGRILGATGRQYGTNAAAARTNLTATKGWTITGDTPSGTVCVSVSVPTITNFTPASGSIGTTVTITGTNFSTTPANNTVAFNGTTAVVTASTTTSITTTVPTGATTGKISVTVAGNTATSAADFTVASVANEPPIIQPIVTAVPVDGIVTIDLLPLISDPDDNLDLSTLSLVSSTTDGGATATLIGATQLELNYGNVAFAGTDRISISVCDLLPACTEQELSIEVSGEIKIYNGLSPNDDQLNPIFLILYIDLLPDTQNNKVSIYNRWGSKVWEGTNYDNDQVKFVGETDSGKELPSGTYYYKIEFESGRKSETGYLLLKK